MRPYKELWWPRFWPFLRVVDEMPSHRLRLPWVSFRKFRKPRSNRWYIRDGNPVLDGLVVGIGIGMLWFRMRGFFPVPRRKASNYGVSIVIRRDVLRYEPWVLQQEIYESRYWLRHPWRLVDFFWFHRFVLNQPADAWFVHRHWGRCQRAAAHLASVECQSRAQEIRAKWESPERARTWVYKPGEREWKEWQAREYARSIRGASNYAFIKAAGWTEDDCYNEIIKHL